MPLLNNESLPPVPDIPDSYLDTHPDAEVWYIPLTGEIFLNYDDFIARSTLYSRPIFTCAHTQKGNLTYAAALDSEYNYRKKHADLLPAILQKPALDLIHLNIHPVNTLVEMLYAYLGSKAFLNEHLGVFLSGEECHCKVLEVIDLKPEWGPDNALAVSVGWLDAKNAKSLIFKEKTKAMSAPGRWDANLERYQYVVHLCTWDARLLTEEESGGFPLKHTVKFDQLHRQRHILSKAKLKIFIKDSGDRWSSAMGSPWICKAELMSKYNLRKTVPAELGLSDRERRALQLSLGGGSVLEVSTIEGQKGGGSRAHKPKLVFPIEDTEIPKVDPTPRLHPETKQPLERPTLCYDFGTIPSTAVTDLVGVYTFLNLFGEVLRIYPFGFPEFIRALEHKNYIGSDGVEVGERCDLLLEVFGGMIYVGCKRWVEMWAAGEVGTVAAAALMGSTEEVREDVKEEEGGTEMKEEGDGKVKIERKNSMMLDDSEAEAHAAFEKALDSLNSDEKLAVEQWYKWYPGRWAGVVTEDAVSSYPESLSATNGSDQNAAPSASGHHQKVQVLSKKAAKAALGNLGCSERLKAWEVALIGFLKEAVGTGRLKNKWKILGVLMGVVEVDDGLQEGVEWRGGEEGEYGDAPNGVVPVGASKDEMQVDETATNGSHEAVDSAPTGRKRRNWDGLDLERVLFDDELSDIAPSPNGKTGGLDDDAHVRRSRRKKRKVASYDVGGSFDGLEGEEDDEFSDHDDEGSPRDSMGSFEADGSDRRSSGRTTRSIAAVSGDVQHMMLEEAKADGDEEAVIETVWSYSKSRVPRGNSAQATGGSKKSGGGSSNVNGGMDIEDLIGKASRNFLKLTAEEKLGILKVLVEDFGMQWKGVRDYVESAVDKVVELKRERRELGREWKELEALRAEMEAHEKEREAARVETNKANGPPAETHDDTTLADNGSEADTSFVNGGGSQAGDTSFSRDMDEESMHGGSASGMDGGADDPMDTLSNSGSFDPPDAITSSRQRQKMLRQEMARKREIELAKKREWNRIRREQERRKKEQKKALDERRKVEDAERTLMRRQMTLDADIRRMSARCRISHIGKDRNHDRYYFLDSLFGSAEPEKLASGAQIDADKGKYSRLAIVKGSLIQTGIKPWMSGCLLVEEVYKDPSSQSAVEGLEGVVETAGSANAQPSRWGYITDVGAYEQLKAWLDVRGVRESELLKAIKNLDAGIEWALRKRQNEIHESATQRLLSLDNHRRMSRSKLVVWKPMYLRYTNEWALSI
ncbi:hypothetical protein HDV05_004073 [Chytridiales sp. JEL 0842]|nr:hypothetical protein HDV05_004073 [Chytridiales sp. JEL 0842]